MGCFNMFELHSAFILCCYIYLDSNVTCDSILESVIMRVIYSSEIYSVYCACITVTEDDPNKHRKADAVSADL